MKSDLNSTNLKMLVNSAYRDSISITHRHILASINTIIKFENCLTDKQIITILDSGCGNGYLIYFLHKYLPLFNKEKNFIIFGYDVMDHGVQEQDYFAKTFDFLQGNAPDIDWSKRIRMIRSDENWPFENETFDFVISNQVLEHVWDHYQYFKENYRVLKNNGFSVHLFPVKEVYIDGHIFLPNVHKLKNWDAIYKKVKFYSKIGLGRYRRESANFNHNINCFARVWADKIYHYCNYQSYAEISKAAKQNKLSLTTRFTVYYYWRKIKEIFGIKSNFYYKKYVSSKVAFYLLKRISGISIVFYKNEYSKY